MTETYVITSAKYQNDPFGNVSSILANIDGVLVAVGINQENRHYAEIMRQVAAGDLTIADAD